MEEKEIKQNFAHNLTKLRKSKKLTQLQLAEKLNYSDKSVSKWECGETLPDIETFTRIAKFFNITVNVLIGKNNNILKNINTKNIAITLLAFFLVWLATCVVYYFLNFLGNFNNIALILICTLPLSFVVLLVFCIIWFNKIFQFLSATGLIWSTAFTLYFIQGLDGWFIFIIATIIQILCVLWFWLRETITKHFK